MICPRCKNDVAPGSKFCPTCGAQLPPESQKKPIKRRKRKKRFYKRWWFWVLVAIFAFFCIGVWASSLPEAPEGPDGSGATSSGDVDTSQPDGTVSGDAEQLSEEQRQVIIAQVDPVIPADYRGHMFEVDAMSVDWSDQPAAVIYLDSTDFSDAPSCSAAIQSVLSSISQIENREFGAALFFCCNYGTIVATAEQHDLAADPAAVEAAWIGPEVPQSEVYTGSGDSVIEITPLSGVYVFKINGNAGSDYFGVTGYDASGNVVDLFVNTTTPYSGTVIDTSMSAVTLEIQATGDWSVELASIYTVPMIDQGETVTGAGDGVIYVTSYGSTATITGNENGAYFGVVSYGSSGNSLLVNEAEPYSGTVMLSGDPMILAITAEGDWSITMD